MNAPVSALPLMRRLTGLRGPAREAIPFELDGRPCAGQAGDTVLTAVLALGDRLRLSDASASPRAGFCGMGACQDCWMSSADGQRLRACTTPLAAGMRLLTRPAT